MPAAPMISRKNLKRPSPQEFIDNVKRIRHHASLGLWCGNNEMEHVCRRRYRGLSARSHLQASGRLHSKCTSTSFRRCWRSTIPQTFYWPASPSSGGGFDAPNDENRGDVHYWDVWHGNKPITELPEILFPLCSPSLVSSPSRPERPSRPSPSPEDRNIFSYVMEKHQRNRRLQTERS